MPDTGEANQVIGMDGTKSARQWLDRTTRASVEADAYDGKAHVRLQLLTGAWAGWDMTGFLRDEEGGRANPFMAECKRHETDSTAGSGYEEFVRNSYSATAQLLRVGDLRTFEFMFITWHPFKVKTWANLCEPETIKKYVEQKIGTKEDVLGDQEFDANIAASLAPRLWLVVICDRQIADLTMSGKWLGRVRDEQTDKTKPVIVP